MAQATAQATAQEMAQEMAQAMTQARPADVKETTATLAARWLFTGPTPLIDVGIYARVERGKVKRDRAELTLAPDTRVSGNTYHGRFMASYWQRWTEIREVRVEMTVTGWGHIAVAASDLGGFARTVHSRQIESADTQTVGFTVAIDRFQDGGALWLVLETGEDERLTVQNVCWKVAAPKAIRPTIAALTAFNRPEYCANILRALADDPTALSRLDRIRVVDQGAPVMADESFRAAVEALGDRLDYRIQPNLGSSGGLCRSLYEETAPESATANFILFDDDIVLEPEVVVRLTAFADHMTVPLILGGQMINLFHTNILLADAQQTDIDGIQPGVPMPHSRIDADLLALDEAGHPAMQERRLDAGYNAWWTILIPAEVVRKAGLLIPTFYGGEDAEFCYRAGEHGFPTVTLPGVGIWHSDFSLAEFDDPKIYFVRRNYLILAALHGALPVRKLAKRFCREMSQNLLEMRYGLAEMVLSAIGHFLDGPSDLHDGGATRQDEIVAARAKHPETFIYPATAVPGVCANSLKIHAAGAKPRFPIWFGIARFFDHLIGRYRIPLGEIAHDEAHWWHVTSFKTAVVTDASQRGVRVRSRNRKLLLALSWRTAKTLLRLVFRGKRAQRAYRQNLKALTGRENWARLFG